MEHQLTIIIPIYNEAENLERLERELIAYLGIAALPTSILFINDGSEDSSRKLIEDMCLRNLKFNFISFNENYGLSGALKAGIDHVQTNLVGYMDADLQTHPEDFNLLLTHIDAYDMVTGVRINRNDSFLRWLSSRIANRLRRFFTQDGIIDTGCPLKVMKADVARRIPMFKGSHRFLPAMIQLQKGTVKQVPVRHYARISGKNKFGVWNRLLFPLIDCFAFIWMKKRYINYKISNSSYISSIE